MLVTLLYQWEDTGRKKDWDLARIMQACTRTELVNIVLHCFIDETYRLQ